MGGPEPGMTGVPLKLSLEGVMDRLLHLLGEDVTVSLGFVPGEQGTLAVVNIGTPDGHDYILSALGVGHLPILRVLLNCLDVDEFGEGIDRGGERV